MLYIAATHYSAGFVYQLSQLSRHSQDGHSEHDAVLHTRGQGSGGSNLYYGYTTDRTVIIFHAHAQQEFTEAYACDDLLPNRR